MGSGPASNDSRSRSRAPTGDDLVALGAEEIRTAAASEGLYGGLAAPLAYRDRPSGVLRLFRRGAAPPSDEDSALLQTLAEQVSAAVQSARLAEEGRRARQTQRHLQLARDIQRRMLPEDLPSHPTLDVAAKYVPCFDLGGDFYDLFEVDGRFALVIGDVVGKGVPAALLMASVRSMFRAFSRTSRAPDRVMEQVNAALAGDTLPNEFATAFVAFIDPESLEMTYCNGGHDPPVLVAPDGRLLELSVGGPLIGVSTEFGYVAERLVLDPGDTFVGYSDGVPDAMNFDAEKFGRARLHQAVRDQIAMDAASASAAIASHVVWEMRRFAGLNTDTDDVTVVALRAR